MNLSAKPFKGRRCMEVCGPPQTEEAECYTCRPSMVHFLWLFGKGISNGVAVGISGDDDGVAVLVLELLQDRK